jgi:hypothetical protein
MADNLGLILAVVALAVLIFLVFIALSILSQGALVESVAALHRGQTRRFSSTWRAGISHFWRVLGLAVLFLLLALGLFLVIVAPTVLAILAILAATNSVLLRVLFIVLVALAAILLLILLGISLSIIGQLALRELVLREERVVGSIGGGYRLFRQNLGRSLLAWLIQAALLFAAWLVATLVLLVLGLGLFALVAALYTAELTAAAIIAGVLAVLIFLAPSLIAAGVLGTFGSSYWTLAYLQLTDEGATTRSGQGA